MAEVSSVFVCRYVEEQKAAQSVRLKRYLDQVTNMNLGKVDLLENSIIVESTPVKVYEIPIMDNRTYVQIWNSSTVRVDAQLSFDQKSRPFYATLATNTQKEPLLCRQLPN